MIRKLMLTAGVAAAVGTFVFGWDAFSYARTVGSSVRNAVKREVPLDFEIERARKEVEQLVPDIHQCMQVIAEQQVDSEHRSREIAERERALGTQKLAMESLCKDLESENVRFVYAGRNYTVDEVKSDLAERFDRFKSAQSYLERERQILRAREKALKANQTKLDNMLTAKKDLEVQVEQLEARLKALQAAESVSRLEFDDTSLARAKKLIRELNKQLDVKERLLDTEGRLIGLIPVDVKPVPENITGEIRSYFNGQPESSDAQVVELNDVGI